MLRLEYNGGVILGGRIEGGTAQLSQTETSGTGIEQHIKLVGKGLSFVALANGSDQLIAAETRGEAQAKFPLVRTSHGMSNNLRNNAIYDRKWDSQLEIIAKSVRITPAGEAPGKRDFALTATGDAIEIIFRPHFYQKRYGLEFFEPWTYRVREDSITGWSSWFAFMRAFSQRDCDTLLQVWKEKHMADFGYRFIQIDDGFQNELGQGQGRPRYPGANSDYPSRGPATWLDWRKDLFPNGLRRLRSPPANSLDLKPGSGSVPISRTTNLSPAIPIGLSVARMASLLSLPGLVAESMQPNRRPSMPWCALLLPAPGRQE